MSRRLSSGPGGAVGAPALLVLAVPGPEGDLRPAAHATYGAAQARLQAGSGHATGVMPESEAELASTHWPGLRSRTRDGRAGRFAVPLGQNTSMKSLSTPKVWGGQGAARPRTPQRPPVLRDGLGQPARLPGSRGSPRGALSWQPQGTCPQWLRPEVGGRNVPGNGNAHTGMCQVCEMHSPCTCYI